VPPTTAPGAPPTDAPITPAATGILGKVAQCESRGDWATNFRPTSMISDWSELQLVATCPQITHCSTEGRAEPISAAARMATAPSSANFSCAIRS
jgi:hypothetical protein